MGMRTGDLDKNSTGKLFASAAQWTVAVLGVPADFGGEKREHFVGGRHLSGCAVGGAWIGESGPESLLTYIYSGKLSLLVSDNCRLAYSAGVVGRDKLRHVLAQTRWCASLR